MPFAQLIPFLGDQFFGGYCPPVEYESVWFRCCLKVLNELRGMSLPGIADPDSQILLLERPAVESYFGDENVAKNTADGNPLSFPGLIVWPLSTGETTDPEEGPNNLDQIKYTVLVSVVDKNAGKSGPAAMVGSHRQINRHMVWRERISKHFRWRNCPDIPEVQFVYVRPVDYLIPNAYKAADLYHGAIAIEFTTWEGRDS